jgi:hypothetical protein
VVQGKRYAVFSIRKTRNGSVWSRAGYAWVNRDDSVNIYLDVLPLEGVLHVREAGEKPREAPSAELVEVGANEVNNEPAAMAAAPMGGH